MNGYQFASLVALSLVAVLAMAGIFSRHFHDNWAQFCGLVLVVVWASARALQLSDMTDVRVPHQGTIGHVGLALYALGTAWKVWRHRPRPADPWAAVVAERAGNDAPYKLEAEQMRRVAGGGSQ